jgi:hypothetical protein
MYQIAVVVVEINKDGVEHNLNPPVFVAREFGVNRNNQMCLA